jgi:hypothetical protein
MFTRRAVVLAFGVRERQEVVPEGERRVIRRDLQQPLQDRDPLLALRNGTAPRESAPEVAPCDHVERRDRHDASRGLHRPLAQAAIEQTSDAYSMTVASRGARAQRRLDLGEGPAVLRDRVLGERIHDALIQYEAEQHVRHRIVGLELERLLEPADRVG